jgi:hypothetical protein
VTRAFDGDAVVKDGHRNFESYCGGWRNDELPPMTMLRLESGKTMKKMKRMKEITCVRRAFPSASPPTARA